MYVKCKISLIDSGLKKTSLNVIRGDDEFHYRMDMDPTWLNGRELLQLIEECNANHYTLNVVDNVLMDPRHEDGEGMNFERVLSTSALILIYVIGFAFLFALMSP